VTVALHDGTALVAAESAVDARRHGELLAPAIRAVLAAAGATVADLTDVAVGVGPGPYTGLRAGLVTARVLGSARGMPVHGACTLDIIAWEAAASAADAGWAGQAGFTVATDARRKEVYWARYAADGSRLTDPAVGAPADAAGGGPVAGEGGLLYPAELPGPIGPRYPSAATLACLTAARLAGGEPMLPAEPLYLRRPDAKVPGPPKRVTP
ncbi:MAG: tRNA (adenosine(37)-N6)-threonylcarbamoyltransferase complex dimerization subunit type 1 TsaB, partial [Actinomycetota bacterium]